MIKIWYRNRKEMEDPDCTRGRKLTLPSDGQLFNCNITEIFRYTIVLHDGNIEASPLKVY